VANLPPIGNPIAVYWDAALTQPAALPVRTRGGYPVNAGTPARLYVGSDYSIQVQNKNGSVIYSAPDGASDRFSSAQISFLQAGSGAVVRTAQSKMRDVVSVLDFGADPTGVSTSFAALQAANDYLAGVGGGQIQIPDGTFLFSTAVTLDSNVSIVGNGSTSILKGGVSSFITATGKSNIEIRNVKFLNNSYRVFFDGCTNVRLIDCYGDGTFATTDVTNQGFWFRACDQVLVQNPYFVDYRDAVYCDKNGATPCGTVTVSGGQIWQTKHGLNVDFPTGVYGVDVKYLYVNNVIFKNIKPSPDASSPASTGYGVYEGDGTTGQLLVVNVSGCSFIDDDGYTTYPMIGCLVTLAKSSRVTNNYFQGPSGGAYVGFLYGSIDQTIEGNTFVSAACQLQATGSTQPESWLVANNTFRDVTGRVLRIGPTVPGPKIATVIGNTFRNCTNGPITFAVCDYFEVIGNSIYECNTSGDTTDNYRAGINFNGNRDGIVSGNTVVNVSAGQCQYGVNIASGPSLNKVVISPNNYFKGMTVAQTRNALNAPPSVGDWAVGDSIWNWSVVAGGTPGWVCTTAGTPGTWKAMANVAA
jgi:hypothetical protein